MKNTLIRLSFILSILLIAFLVLRPIEQKQYTQQEMDNISKAFAQKFAEAAAKRKAEQAEIEMAKNSSANPPMKQATSKDSNPHPSKNGKNQLGSQQAIIAVIYKQATATWFIKAKNSKENIDTVSASFKNYFIDQLKFDKNQQPDFSHLPSSMITENKSSMRVATFLIGVVEVSVSRLAGQQDVDANVKRWMRQIGLDETSPIQLDFKNNNKTIIVKLPQ